MENLQHFADFWFSWNCVAWVAISGVTTATIATMIGMPNDVPKQGWKIGLVSGVAFTFGVLSTHVPLF